MLLNANNQLTSNLEDTNEMSNSAERIVVMPPVMTQLLDSI